MLCERRDTPYVAVSMQDGGDVSLACPGVAGMGLPCDDSSPTKPVGCRVIRSSRPALLGDDCETSSLAHAVVGATGAVVCGLLAASMISVPTFGRSIDGELTCGHLGRMRPELLGTRLR